MPAPDLVTAELTLTGCLTTASNATFLGSIGDAAVTAKYLQRKSFPSFGLHEAKHHLHVEQGLRKDI